MCEVVESTCKSTKIFWLIGFYSENVESLTKNNFRFCSLQDNRIDWILNRFSNGRLL